MSKLINFVGGATLGLVGYAFGKLAAKPKDETLEKDIFYQHHKHTDVDGETEEFTTLMKTSPEPQPALLIVTQSPSVNASTQPGTVPPVGASASTTSHTHHTSTSEDVKLKADITVKERYGFFIFENSLPNFWKWVLRILAVVLLGFLLYGLGNFFFGNKVEKKSLISEAQAATPAVTPGNLDVPAVDTAVVKRDIFESVSQHSDYVVSNITLFQPAASVYANVAMLRDYRKPHEPEPNGNIYRRVINTEYPKGKVISYEHVDYPDKTGRAGTGAVNLLELIDGRIVTTHLASYSWAKGNKVKK